MAAAASLTLALVHFAVWLGRRGARAELFFSVAATRLHELGAIEQIEQVRKSDAFLDAAKAAALQPVQSVVKIVSD
ncbi:MAG: hypothetical protein ABIP85_22155, partial [Chthoniobacteraceae bacterium]